MWPGDGRDASVGRHARQFGTFALVGIAGFAADAASLHLALLAGAGLYLGRVFSYLVAATLTWALNRRFTFAVAARPGIGEWVRFLLANATGGSVNYLVYAAAVTFVAVCAAHPVLAVALGSISGLALNYAASRAFVFRQSPQEPSPLTRTPDAG